MRGGRGRGLNSCDSVSVRRREKYQVSINCGACFSSIRTLPFTRPSLAVANEVSLHARHFTES